MTLKNSIIKNFSKILCSYQQGNAVPQFSLIHTSFWISSYDKKPEKITDQEINILNKTNAPKLTDNILVTDSHDPVKPRAANHFATTSIFYDETVNKFVNCIMYGGQKVAAQNVMKDTFELIKAIQIGKYHKASENKNEIEIDPLKIFHKAMENAKPILGTQTMKKKGKNFQVPYPLPDKRRRFLAIKWFITTARGKPGNSTPMSVKLSTEILDAYNNEGTVIQKKIDYHKRAEVNRAYAHYRWW